MRAHFFLQLNVGIYNLEFINARRAKPGTLDSPEGTILSKPRARHASLASVDAALGTLHEATMPQSLAQIYVHIVFSTKDRRPWLTDDVRDELHAYLAAIFRDNADSPPLEIGSVEDHVHSLVRLSRRFPVMKVVQDGKVETSKWVKRQRTVPDTFAWQAGYGAFSVSASMVEHVKSYIRNQKEHHQRMSFQEEFRELCRRHGLELDERYVWDWNRPVGTL